MNGGWHEFKVMLETGSYDIYQPDATMGGGIGDVMRLMVACRERGLGYTPHTWTNGLGIELDEDKLARYGEKYFEITSSGLFAEIAIEHLLRGPNASIIRDGTWPKPNQEEG